MCLIAIGIVLLCVAALFTVMYVRENYEWPPWEKKEKKVLYVERGDEVKVDYIGRFQDGRIFDTNIEKFGRNASYEKSATFDPDKQYTPLSFVVGAGSMVQGFDEGVMGMKKGQTKFITVPPSKGYGAEDPELVFTIPVVDTVSMYETFSRRDFDSNYSSEIVSVGISSAHHFWGWPIRIVSIDNESVTIENNPVYGENYRGFSWNTTITGISTQTGEIMLKHLVGITPKDPLITPDRFRKYDAGLPTDATEKGVITVDNNQIIFNFNREVVGKTLVFEVTLKELTKGED